MAITKVATLQHTLRVRGFNLRLIVILISCSKTWLGLRFLILIFLILLPSSLLPGLSTGMYHIL
jgi:hypothetical protein